MEHLNSCPKASKTEGLDFWIWVTLVWFYFYSIFEHYIFIPNHWYNIQKYKVVCVWSKKQNSKTPKKLLDVDYTKKISNFRLLYLNLETLWITRRFKNMQNRYPLYSSGGFPKKRTLHHLVKPPIVLQQRLLLLLTPLEGL